MYTHNHKFMVASAIAVVMVTIGAIAAIGRINGRAVDIDRMAGGTVRSTVVLPVEAPPVDGPDMADRWITIQVRTNYRSSGRFEGTAIAVSTSSGIVTLVGKVNDGGQRITAIALARTVQGVKDVDAKRLRI